MKAFYDEVNAIEKRFEVVVCSLDRSEDGFRGTFGPDTPWLAIPFNVAERAAVQGKYPAPGVPTLTIVNLQGKVLAAEGDTELGMGSSAFDGWAKRA